MPNKIPCNCMIIFLIPIHFDEKTYKKPLKQWTCYPDTKLVSLKAQRDRFCIRKSVNNQLELAATAWKLIKSDGVGKNNRCLANFGLLWYFPNWLYMCFNPGNAVQARYGNQDAPSALVGLHHTEVAAKGTFGNFYLLAGYQAGWQDGYRRFKICQFLN